MKTMTIEETIADLKVFDSYCNRENQLTVASEYCPETNTFVYVLGVLGDDFPAPQVEDEHPLYQGRSGLPTPSKPCGQDGWHRGHTIDELCPTTGALVPAGAAEEARREARQDEDDYETFAEYLKRRLDELNKELTGETIDESRARHYADYLANRQRKGGE